MSEKKRFLDALQRASQNAKLLDNFLCDLLTDDEYSELVTRWRIVRELQHGKAQRRIAAGLGVGIATVTRGSKMLKNKKGGFQKILQTYENI
ncbi:transcriptional regulator [Candidatus Uhrbacteria bacterium]|nr:transcriptional regulator [Candidatus Uhrbacteria bacterium]